MRADRILQEAVAQSSCLGRLIRTHVTQHGAAAARGAHDEQRARRSRVAGETQGGWGVSGHERTTLTM